MSGVSIAMLVQALACGYILHQILFDRSLIKYPGHLLYFRILVIGLVWQFVIEFTLIFGKFDVGPYDDFFKKIAPLITALAIYEINRFSLSLGNEVNKKRLNIGRCWGDASDELLMRAAYRDFPILVTTTNNKVYVGWVAVFNLDDKLEWLSIIPLFSGYRVEKTKEVVFNVNYFQYYEEKKIEEFLNVNLSTDKITSIQKFDYNFFEFNKTQRELQSAHQTNASP